MSMNPIKCHSCSARASRLCSSLDEDAIYELDAIATRIEVSKGNYIFQEEDPSSYVYNISTGMGYLERLSSDGRRQIMAFLFPGDYIGLIPDPIVNVSAGGLTDMSVCRWNIKDIENLIDKHPEFEHRLRRIGNRVLATTLDQLFMLGCKDAREKLAFFLLQMEKRQLVALGEIETIHLPMTRGDIADYLGITVETVSRIFTRIKKEGLIELPDSNEVVIKNRELLEEIAEYNGIDY
ncbi:helix-turn-helix domain-containing protein [Temperatibacter marinus]|uniref:Helix-turn-helix domain-containing protein n=1 Tax=Temperatibacter marinus TaxID=1456591 RepID=A0AA52EEU5_9PROT|nr:helix-turn-helix domain-containing protein [Temperatibacter marinus]WND03496.1 helix-turn-helix domain-containing protein [Temperatibacter marinus]